MGDDVQYKQPIWVERTHSEHAKKQDSTCRRNDVVKEYPIEQGLDMVLKAVSDGIDKSIGFESENIRDFKKDKVYLRKMIVEQDITRQSRMKIFKGTSENVSKI